MKLKEEINAIKAIQDVGVDKEDARDILKAAYLMYKNTNPPKSTYVTIPLELENRRYRLTLCETGTGL